MPPDFARFSKPGRFLNFISGSRQRLILICIMLLAFGVRLYYIKANTAIWWDEGDYLMMVRSFAGQTDEGWWPGRPPLLPLIWCGMSAFGMGEMSFRMSEVFFSAAGVYLTYLLGRKMYGSLVGLAAGFGMAVFWMHIFYTERLLTGVPSLFFWLLAAYYFWTGHEQKKARWRVWLVGPAAALAVLTRFPAGIILPVIGIYLLLTKRPAFLRDRDIWISIMLFWIVLSPYLAWSYYELGSPLEPFMIGQGTIAEDTPGYSSGLLGYLAWFPGHYLHSAFFALFIAGLAGLYEMLLGIDLIIKGKADKTGNSRLRADLFLVLWIIMPLIYFSFFVGHNEDRYLMHIFPAVFIIAAKGARTAYYYIKRYSRPAAVIAVSAVLVLGGIQQLAHADAIIRIKQDSFSHVKEAAIWVKANSAPEEKTANEYWPIFSYYSERESVHLNTGEAEFESIRKNDSSIRYYALFSEHYSEWKWQFEYPEEKGLEVAKAFYVDGNPAAVIYKLK